MECKSDYSEYKNRLLTYKNCRIRAYAVIWDRCTRGMRQKVESRLEFSEKIENNPIELLKAIKEHTQSYQEHRYGMSIVLDSLKNLLSTKQKDGEPLHNWTKQFKTSRDIFEAHMGGPFIIDKVTK
jgi:hypothetical protein